MIKLTVLLTLCSGLSFGQLKGKVVSIADGDTFTILIKNKQQKIRLYGIDCPEQKQDFGYAAKKYLSGLIVGKTVTVIYKNKDRYGRIIGIAYLDTVNINENLLLNGLAWHYKNYDKNPKWASYEERARKAKAGLWINSNTIAPWEFRKSIRKKKTAFQSPHLTPVRDSDTFRGQLSLVIK